VETGDERLRVAAGGWEFTNEHYRARISRNGALVGLWLRDGDDWRKAAGFSDLAIEKGAMGNPVEYAQGNDGEAAIHIEAVSGKTPERSARGRYAVSLTFSGRLRGFERGDKMARPVHFSTRYIFGDKPDFSREAAFRLENPAPDKPVPVVLRFPVERPQGMKIAGNAAHFPAAVPSHPRWRIETTEEPSTAATGVAAAAKLSAAKDGLRFAWEIAPPKVSAAPNATPIWQGIRMRIICEK
jgi:hypothetical protein